MELPLLLRLYNGVDCSFLQHASYTFFVAMIQSSFNLSVGTLFISHAELPKFSTASTFQLLSVCLYIFVYK